MGQHHNSSIQNSKVKGTFGVNLFKDKKENSNARKHRKLLPYLPSDHRVRC